MSSRGLYFLAVEPLGLRVLPKTARSSMMRRTVANLLLTLVVVLTFTANLVYAQSTSAMMSHHHCLSCGLICWVANRVLRGRS